MIKRIQLIK